MPDQDESPPKPPVRPGRSTLEDEFAAIALKAMALAGRYVSPQEKADLRADYQTAVDIIKVLTDIRFRCLVFVTSIIAIANALMPNNALDGTKITFALVGFFTTLGIAVYELRNSQLYEAAIHRAKVLEARMQLTETSYKSDRAGLFNERPIYVEKSYGHSLTNEEWAHPKDSGVRLMTYLFIKVKHDQGLALIYGAVLGGWFYLVAHGLLSVLISRGYWPAPPVDAAGKIAALLGFAVFLFAWRRFIYHDNHRFAVTRTKPEDKAEPTANSNGKGAREQSVAEDTVSDGKI